MEYEKIFEWNDKKVANCAKHVRWEYSTTIDGHRKKANILFLQQWF